MTIVHGHKLHWALRPKKASLLDEVDPTESCDPERHALLESLRQAKSSGERVKAIKEADRYWKRRSPGAQEVLDARMELSARDDKRFFLWTYSSVLMSALPVMSLLNYRLGASSLVVAAVVTLPIAAVPVAVHGSSRDEEFPIQPVNMSDFISDLLGS